MSTEPELSVPEGSGAGLACLLNPIKHHAAAPGTVPLSKPPVAAIPHSLEIVPDKMLPICTENGKNPPDHHFGGALADVKLLVKGNAGRWGPVCSFVCSSEWCHSPSLPSTALMHTGEPAGKPM